MAQPMQTYEVNVTVKVRVTTGAAVPLSRVVERAKEALRSGDYAVDVIDRDAEMPEALV